MIHVAYIVSRINKGNPINQLFYLCKYIDFNQFKFIIITTSPRNNPNSYHKEFNELGIEVIDLSLGKISSITQGVTKINNIIRNRNIQIAQSFGFRADYITSQLKGVYKITSIRNRILFNYRIIYGFFPGTFFCYLNLFFIKKFDKIIACSHAVKKHLDLLGIKSQVIVNAIDKSIIPKKVQFSDKLAFRESLKLFTQAKIFITISSNLPGKNIEFLIKAFVENEELQNDILLIAGIVGQDLLKKYVNYQNIRFIGKVNNLFEFYKASDYFVSASVSEGMPNAVLEAMMLGCPVILSDIDAHLEIHKSANQKVGAIFKNNDIQNLLKCINELNSYDYKQLSENSTRCVTDSFNAQIMSEQYQKLYFELEKKNSYENLNNRRFGFHWHKPG